MTLEGLALSRSTHDRAAERRTDDSLLDRMLGDPGAQAMLLHAGRVLVRGDHDGLRLALMPAPAALHAVAGHALTPIFLGREKQGFDVVALLLAGAPGEEPPDPGRFADARPGSASRDWMDLRAAGERLDATGAGLMTSAVAVANWHDLHPRCARCGSPTRVTAAGWSRTCPHCGAQHFPRTDPAVIMAVVDEEDRLLLGHQKSWPDKRYSTLAGFVEAGESLEAAVRREVYEESGVRVGEVSYRGSQPWPFPASLMLGFRAQALSTTITVDGDEIANARWWTREELTIDVASGDVLLPPPVSIARRLVEEWYGRPIKDAGGAWR